MENLLIRTVSGICFVAAVVLSILYVGECPYAYSALFLLLTLIASYELLRMAKRLDYHPQMSAGVILPGVLFLVSAFALMSPCGLCGRGISFLLLAALVLFVLFAEVFRNKAHALANVAITFLPVVWVGIPFALLSLLIAAAPDVALATFILLWLNDTLAYCVGSLFGRHKLCERISPHKSIEGFVGALVLTAALSMLFSLIPYFNTFNQSGGHRWMLWMGLSVVVVLSGTLGDLLESLFKRDCGVKDSGKMIPGHGGVLDRMDSSLLAIPVAYLFFFIAELYNIL